MTRYLGKSDFWGFHVKNFYPIGYQDTPITTCQIIEDAYMIPRLKPWDISGSEM